MSTRDRIAAYKAAVGPTASDELRYAVSDADAVELAESVTTPRHGELLAKGIAAVKALAEQPPADQVDALTEWALKRKAALNQLWDALEGEVVDGVTIIRRR